ncbi:hypothetical protein SESBI_00878 [Sesbania bispinosa]|nr:hypothetical protein SESBI_00878 [Sesbania bispinosa]
MAMQTRIRVAKHLNDCLLPRLDEIVKFKDPAGNIHNIAVNIHDDRQWFEDGLLQMMQFYNLQQEVQIHYTYTLNNDFELKIWRPHGLGEIQYPQRRQVHQDIKEEPQEVIDIEDDIEIKDEPQEVIDIPDDLQQFPSGAAANVLWTTKLTKAQEGGRQGLVGTSTAGKRDLRQVMKFVFGKWMVHNTYVSKYNVTGNRTKFA